MRLNATISSPASRASPSYGSITSFLDRIWLREFSDLDVLTDTSQILPTTLFLNAHAKSRISIELAFSTNLGEARSILRDAVEYVAHAHHMLNDPNKQDIWLNRGINPKAFTLAFEDKKTHKLFKGLEELHEKWRQLSDIGSHANPVSLSQHLTIQTDSSGGRRFELSYLGGGETKRTEMTLFSLLLTCFAMENLFYADYKMRLELDDVLIGMRSNFEKYKETLRSKIKAKYKLKEPATKPSATHPD